MEELDNENVLNLSAYKDGSDINLQRAQAEALQTQPGNRNRKPGNIREEYPWRVGGQRKEKPKEREVKNKRIRQILPKMEILPLDFPNSKYVIYLIVEIMSGIIEILGL